MNFELAVHSVLEMYFSMQIIESASRGDCERILSAYF